MIIQEGYFLVIFITVFTYFLPDAVETGFSTHQHGCNICQHSASESDPITNRCKRPSSPIPGYISCTYDSTYMKCIGTCMAGYMFPSGRTEMELQCSTNDALWYPLREFPNCVQQRGGRQREDGRQREGYTNDYSVTLSRCKRPPTPVRGIISCTYDSNHMLCIGSCNSGYVFPDGRSEMQLECRTEQAVWYPSNEYPHCIERRNIYRENEQYRQKEDQSNSDLSAILKRCIPPVAPAYGSFHCTYDAEHMLCTGSCYSGYVFPDGRYDIQIECRMERVTWYPLNKYPDCVKGQSSHSQRYEQSQQNENSKFSVTLARCKRPEAPTDGYLYCSYDDYYMLCTATCNSGFKFPNNQKEIKSECRTERGVWYPLNEFPSCIGERADRYEETEQSRQVEDRGLAVTLSRCKRPLAPTAGISRCTYDSEHMVCTGSCNSGYAFPDGRLIMQLECRTNQATWYPVNEYPNCVEIRDSYRQTQQQENQNNDFSERTDRYEETEQSRQVEDRGLAVTLSRCKRPLAPTAGISRCTYDSEHMVCTGSCNSGYAFPDGRLIMQLECRTNQATWYPVNEYPNCVEIRDSYRQTQQQENQNNDFSGTLLRCKRPSAPVSGVISCKYDDLHMLCTGRCNSGYQFPDGSEEIQLECRTRRGVWYPLTEYPDCVKVQTAIPTAPIRISEPHPSEQDHNSGLSVTLSRCKQPLAPLSGTSRCTYDAEHMRCIGKCNRGYVFPDGRTDITLECKTNRAVWYPIRDFPSCIKETEPSTDVEQYQQKEDQSSKFSVTLLKCRKPEAPLSGYIKCTYDDAHMLCIGSCSSGFVFPEGESEIKLYCKTDAAVWYPLNKYPSCVKENSERYRENEQQQRENDNDLLAVTVTKCRRPASPKPGRVSCTYDTEGMKCTGTCDSGYYFPDGKSGMIMHCLTRDAKWLPFDKFPECNKMDLANKESDTEDQYRPKEDNFLEAKCLKPSPPQSGYIYCKYDLLGMNCTGTCKAGFYFPSGKNEMILDCINKDGIWYPYEKFPDCLKLGHQNINEMEQTLSQTSEEKQLIAITLRKCRRPSIPAYGQTSCRYNSTNMLCTGSCEPDYFFPDGNTEMILSCTTDSGLWYPVENFPDCTSKHNLVTVNKCGRISAPVNGYISCSNKDNTVICVGRCKYYYTFPDNKKEVELMCYLQEGFWYPLQYFPNCMPKEDDKDQDKVLGNERITVPEEANGGNCEDKPKPPVAGYVTCVKYINKRECTGTCMPNYAFPDGFTAMVLNCQFESSEWTPQAYFPSCILKSDIVNRDKLLPGQNFPDKENYTVSPICSKPSTPKGGYIHCEGQIEAGFRKCTGTCMPNFVFPDGNNAVILRCSIVRGWLPTSVFPACVAKVENDERREGQELDVTNRGDIGQHQIDINAEGYRHSNTSITDSRNSIRQTEYERRGLCRFPTVPKFGYAYCLPNAETVDCTAKCAQGFEFPNHETRLVYSCEKKSGRWSPRGKFPDCIPVCEVGCNNGGVCVGPNQCYCTQDYRGDFCQYPLSNCDPHHLKFAGNIKCNHTTEETVCKIGCPESMVLEEPSNYIVKCSLNGIWTPRLTPRCVDDPKKNSDNDCKNTQCVSTLTDSGLCHRPSSPRPGSIRCIFNRLMMECTSKCAAGYKFPNGRTELVTKCDSRTGIWTPSHSFTDCEPICDEQCKNGGNCIAHNFCSCPINYRGNLCQYPLLNCSPQQLRFIGSVRCNHTTEDTTCLLECPDGFKFNTPTSHIVRCSLDGIWMPRDLPRCVEVTNRRTTIPVYESHRDFDSQTRHNFEHDYRQIESTQTARNNYEHQYRQSQLDEQRRLNYEQHQKNQSINSEEYRQSQIDRANRENYEQRQTEHSNRENYNQRYGQNHTDRLNYEQQRRQTDHTNKENYEQQQQKLQIENERMMRHRLLNEENKENYQHQTYDHLRNQENFQQRQDASTYEHMLRKNQSRHDHVQNFDNLQTQTRLDDTSSHHLQNNGMNSDKHSDHTGHVEMGGYGSHVYRKRVNQSESGVYREESAHHQHHYYQKSHTRQN